MEIIVWCRFPQSHKGFYIFLYKYNPWKFYFEKHSIIYFNFKEIIYSLHFIDQLGSHCLSNLINESLQNKKEMRMHLSTYCLKFENTILNRKFAAYPFTSFYWYENGKSYASNLEN